MNRKFARRSDLASRPAPRRPGPEAGRGQKPDAENTKEKQREHEEEREYLRAALKTVERSPLCRAAAQRSASASPPGERCAHFELRQADLRQIRQINNLRYGFMESEAKQSRDVPQNTGLLRRHASRNDASITCHMGSWGGWERRSDGPRSRGSARPSSYDQGTAWWRTPRMS